MFLLDKRNICAQQVRLDDKLFAHIHNDARLKGTHLEGNTFNNTVGYINEVLQYVIRNDCGIPEKQKEKIAAALKKTEAAFQLLMKNERAVMGIIQQHNSDYNPEGASKSINQLAASIVAQIIQNNMTMIPGGWSGLPGGSGHAMCYKFLKDNQGNLTFLVYNTGAGIENHLQQTTSKDKYSPIMAYQIPGPINEKNLTTFISQLLVPQIYPQLTRIADREYIGDWKKDNNFNSNRLYNEVIAKVGFLGGQKLDPTKFSKRWTQGQLSGTCSMRVLMPTLEEAMGRKAFLHFLYQLNLQSIIDYYKLHKNSFENKKKSHGFEYMMLEALGDVTSDPQRFAIFERQLRSALNDFAIMNYRLLNRQKRNKTGDFVSKPIITERQAKSAIEMIETIRKDLDRLASTADKKPPSLEQFAKHEHNQLFSINSREGLVPDIKGSIEQSEAQKVMPKYSDFASPLTYLKKCQETLVANVNQHYHDAVLQDIEKMMLFIPISAPEAKEYWDRLSPKEAKEALTILQSIMRIYGNQCYLKGGYPFGQRWLTAATFMFTGGLIANRQFNNAPKLGHLAGYIIEAIKNSNLTKDPYSVTKDPLFDKRLAELHSIHAKMKSESAWKPTLAKYEFYDVELLDKYNQNKELIGLDPNNRDVASGYDELDRARVQMYRLAQGQVDKKMGSTDKFLPLLDDLEFCIHFQEFCNEAKLFEQNVFDHFKTSDFETHQDKELRLQKLKFKRRSQDSIVGNEHRTYFEFSNGVIEPKGFPRNIKDVYNFADPVIEDELFTIKYQKGYSSIEEEGDYTFQTNEALLRFDSIAKKLDKLKFPAYPSKTLPLTRSQIPTRPVTTIDFFEANLDLLNDKDNQNLCLLNLLTPGAFFSQIEETPDIANQWVELLEKGLNYYIKGNKIESGGYFCFTLSYYLLKYLDHFTTMQRTKGLDEAIMRLENLDKRIEHFIDEHQKIMRDAETDPNTRMSSLTCIKQLELISLLRKSVSLTKKKVWSQHEIINIINSLFYRTMVHAKRGSFLDPFSEEELDKQIQAIRPLLLSQFTALNSDIQLSILKKAINAYLIPDIIPNENFTLNGKFPLISIAHDKIGSVAIDFSTGNVKGSKYVYRCLPSEFYTQDFIRYFGDKEFKAQIFVSAKERVAEFTDSETQKQFRIILDPKGIARIQCKILNNDQWFELQDKKEHRGKAIIDKLLPRHFVEEGRYIYSSVGENPPSEFYMTDKNGNFQLKMSNVKSMGEKAEIARAQELDAMGVPTGYSLLELNSELERYPFLEALANFESIDFIEIYQRYSNDNTKPQFKVKLPRYGLEFETVYNAEARDTKLQLHCRNHPGFVLSMRDAESLVALPFHLTLEKPNLKAPTKLERIVLVPRQEFYPDPDQKKDGEYYALNFDLDHTLQHIRMDQKDTSLDHYWTFQGQESYSTFRLLEEDLSIDSKSVKDINKLKGGILSANSTEDWLYLAYLYLAKHDPKHAYEALKKCDEMGGIKGNPDEIDLIQKIMKEIPSPDFDDKLYEKVKTNDPETLAVRLKAAYLLANFKNISLDKPNFELAMPKGLGKYETYNDKIKDVQTKKRIEFYLIGFQEEANQIYQDYFKVVGVIPETLQLPPEEEVSLLRQLYKDMPRNKAYGFVQGRVRELELISLTKEALQLELKNKQSRGLDNRDQKRLDHINQILKTGNPYAVSKSKLGKEEFEINLLFPKFLPADFETLCNTKYHYRWFKKEPSVIPPSELRADIHLDNFLYSFESLYNLAKMKPGQGGKSETEDLKIFLDNMIKAWAETNAPKITPMIYLCLVLNTVQRNPNTPWPTFKNSSSNEAQASLLAIGNLAKEVMNKVGPNKLTGYRYLPETVQKKAIIKQQKESVEPLPTKTYVQLNSKLPRVEDNILCRELGLTLIKDAFEAGQKVEVKQEKDQRSILDRNDFTHEFHRREIDKFSDDYFEGGRLNALNTLSRKPIRDVLEAKEIRKQLTQKLETGISNLAPILKKLEVSIITLANLAITGEKTKIATALKVSAGREPLTMADLFTLYLQNDLDFLIEKTGLDEKSAIDLYQQIHQFLIRATALQQMKRTVKAISDLGNKDSSSPDYDALINALASELTAYRDYSPNENPEMLLFEYLDDKLIRNPQRRMIIELLKKEEGGYSNKVMQLIMGGGKSKVIMPLLALKKADGTNLSMIEVPASLFETNLADLQATSQKLFGQKGYPFTFSRDLDLTEADLKSQYKKLRQITAERGYVITTAESIQALELKYIELLGTPTSNREAWEKEVFYLEKILKLIKNRGDVLIDEVDSILDPKKELNFTIGGDVSLPESYYKTILGIYDLLPFVKLTQPKEATFEEIMLGRKELFSEGDWKAAMESLLTTLLSHPLSPLYGVIQKLGPQDIKQLQEYLLETSDNIPKFINELDQEDKDKIGLTKAEMQIMPMTLQRKPDENYGFPKDPKSGADLNLAIPYMANNTPNERAQFGSYVETANFTIQLHKRKEKLPLSVLKEFVDEFYALANYEVTESLGKLRFEETEAYQRFYLLTNKTKNLNQLDSRNDIQMAKWQEELIKEKVSNKKLIDYCLTNYVLGKIKQHQFILRSDAVNHASQFRSRQGMTGTPWNYRCFHRSLKFNERESLGVDGQTLDHLMKKKPNISTMSKIEPAEIVNSLFGNHPHAKRLHAFIDIGAMFNGISNEMVARLIAKQLANTSDNLMSKVLYFNEDNLLCAVPVNKDGRGNPIVIGSSDTEVINKKTGTTPSERFTYYDQRHTTGTDILQAPDAIAFATIDKKTLARDFLQGVMRMRGLSGSQTVEIVLPKTVAETRASNEPWEIEDICRFVLNNQYNKLAELHYQGAIQNMNDAIREDILSRIYSKKTIAEKASLYKELSEAFLLLGLGNPFSEFGGIERLEDTKLIFADSSTPYAEKGLAAKTLQRWKQLLSKAQIVPTREQESRMLKVLENISREAQMNCLEKCKQVTSGRDTAVLSQVDKEKSKEKEKEKEQLIELLKISKQEQQPFKPIDHKRWVIGSLAYMQDLRNQNIQVSTINEMIATSTHKPNFIFDSNLLVSENFMNSYEGQLDKMDQYRKPVNFYLLKKEPNPPYALQAMLITQEEALEFAQSIKSDKPSLNQQNKHYWVLTPHNRVYAGTDVNVNLNQMQGFDRIREQICYLNADLDLLVKNPKQMQWMQDNSKAKLQFLESNILPNYPERQKVVAPLIRAFNVITLGGQLLQAVQNKDDKETAALLEQVKRLQPEQRDKILNNVSKEGLTPLLIAINHFKTANLQFEKQKLNHLLDLLIKIPDIELAKADEMGRTPLSIAIELKNNELIDKFIKLEHSMPDPIQLKSWQVLLSLVLKPGFEEVLKFLIDKINALPSNKNKPLLAALWVNLIENNRLDILGKLLKSFKADLKFRDSDGNTLIEYAIISGNISAVQFLLSEANSLPPIKDTENWGILLEKSLLIKNVKVFVQVCESLIKKGEVDFVLEFFKNKLKEAQRTENLANISYILAFFAIIRTRFNLEEWRELLITTVQSASFNQLNTVQNAMERGLDVKERNELYQTQVEVKQVFQPLLSLALPKINDNEVLYAKRTALFKQMIQDQRFRPDVNDDVNWRTLLNRAISINNPEILKEILSIINGMSQENRNDILHFGKKAFMEDYGGPLLWANVIEIRRMRGLATENAKKKEEIKNMLLAMPDIYPKPHETRNWSEVLRLALDEENTESHRKMILDRFAALPNDAQKKAILDYAGETLISGTPSLIIDLALEKNQPKIAEFLRTQTNFAAKGAQDTSRERPQLPTKPSIVFSIEASNVSSNVSGTISESQSTQKKKMPTQDKPAKGK